jgi:hypothetical protein
MSHSPTRNIVKPTTEPAKRCRSNVVTSSYRSVSIRHRTYAAFHSLAGQCARTSGCDSAYSNVGSRFGALASNGCGSNEPCHK